MEALYCSACYQCLSSNFSKGAVWLRTGTGAPGHQRDTRPAASWPQVGGWRPQEKVALLWYRTDYFTALLRGYEWPSKPQALLPLARPLEVTLGPPRRARPVGVMCITGHRPLGAQQPVGWDKARLRSCPVNVSFPQHPPGHTLPNHHSLEEVGLGRSPHPHTEWRTRTSFCVLISLYNQAFISLTIIISNMRLETLSDFSFSC